MPNIIEQKESKSLFTWSQAAQFDPGTLFKGYLKDSSIVFYLIVVDDKDNPLLNLGDGCYWDEDQCIDDKFELLTNPITITPNKA